MFTILHPFQLHTYIPGPENVKPDALSRQFQPEEKTDSKTNILPFTCFVGTLTWDIDNIIRLAQTSDPDPSSNPPGTRNVPKAVISKVLDWVHNYRFTCHPGVSRIISFTKRYFW